MIYDHLEKDQPAFKELRKSVVEHIETSFQAAFIKEDEPDFFKCESEIHPFYEKTFQPEIFNSVIELVRQRFFEAFEQEEPSMLVVYYQNLTQAVIEQELLPTFKHKFTARY